MCQAPHPLPSSTRRHRHPCQQSSAASGTARLTRLPYCLVEVVRELREVAGLPCELEGVQRAVAQAPRLDAQPQACLHRARAGGLQAAQPAQVCRHRVCQGQSRLPSPPTSAITGYQGYSWLPSPRKSAATGISRLLQAAQPAQVCRHRERHAAAESDPDDSESVPSPGSLGSWLPSHSATTGGKQARGLTKRVGTLADVGHRYLRPRAARCLLLSATPATGSKAVLKA